MEETGGETGGPLRVVQFPGQEIGHEGAAYRVAPESQAIGEVARGGTAEKPGGAAGDDDFQEFLGAEEQQGLVEGVDLPAQPEKGRVADPQDIGGDSRVELDDVHQFLDAHFRLVEEEQRPLGHQGKWGQGLQGLQYLRYKGHDYRRLKFNGVLTHNLDPDVARGDFQEQGPGLAAAHVFVVDEDIVFKEDFAQRGVIAPADLKKFLVAQDLAAARPPSPGAGISAPPGGSTP